MLPWDEPPIGKGPATFRQPGWKNSDQTHVSSPLYGLEDHAVLIDRKDPESR